MSTPNGDTPNGDTPNPTPNPHTQRGKEENKTAIIYNDDVTVWNIPLEAYEYVVNGKSAIEWSMERHAVTTRKKRLPRPACVGPPAFNFPLPLSPEIHLENSGG